MKRIQEIADVGLLGTKLSSSEDWGKLTEEHWKEWPTSFTGKHHCEAMLSCLRAADDGSGEDRREVSSLLKVFCGPQWYLF